MESEVEDAVRALPSDFLSVYLLLFERGLRTGSSGVSDAAEVGVSSASRVTRLSTNHTSTRGGSKGSRKTGKSQVPIRDERAIAYRARVDRKIRAITREMKIYLGPSVGEVERPRRCSVCKKYGEPSWLYCPRDGKVMEEVT